MDFSLGQPQQRPPNLTANPALTSQFRPSYPSYGMPPRNVLQGGGGFVTGLQPNSHRAATQQSQPQSLTPQPTQGFGQPRGQSSFAFGGGLGQHPPSSVLQQQPLPSQQQSLSNGTQNMASLLGQSSGLGGAPSVSSASEVGLDPNDFPALGSAPANPNPSNSNNGGATGATTSYASQAGTGVLLGGTGNTGGAIGNSTTVNQTRDFTPDDFPALGGQSQGTQQNRDPQTSTQESLSHPPGLNGFQPSEQQLRQNLLGAHSVGLPQSTPGMLSLGPTQSRSVHPGFQGQTEAEKQQQRVSRIAFHDIDPNPLSLRSNLPTSASELTQPGAEQLFVEAESSISRRMEFVKHKSTTTSTTTWKRYWGKRPFGIILLSSAYHILTCRRTVISLISFLVKVSYKLWPSPILFRRILTKPAVTRAWGNFQYSCTTDKWAATIYKQWSQCR